MGFGRDDVSRSGKKRISRLARSLIKPLEKEDRVGHMIKCLLTELGRAGRELNIWLLVIQYGPREIFSPSGPPTQSIST